MLSASQHTREDTIMCQSTRCCTGFLQGSFWKRSSVPTEWHLRASVFPHSASSNWTSLLNSLLERRGNIHCIVLCGKKTKPIVKLVTRVLWQLSRKLYMPIKWAFYHWHWPRIPSLAELPLKSKESCPSK